MSTRATILEHIIKPQQGGLSLELAKYVLTLDFPARDRRRYLELSGKAQQGELTAEEQAELDEFLNVNDFLTIIQSKARTSLRRNPAA